MDRYRVFFAFGDTSSGTSHVVDLTPEDFQSWNRRIDDQRTLTFYDVSGILITINTRFLVGYRAEVVR